MKKVSLLACLMLLTLGANAQIATIVRPNAIPPNAHRGPRTNDAGVTTVSSQAPKPAPNGGPQGPPVAKVPPNSTVPPVVRK